jgi:hypothetical protein
MNIDRGCDVDLRRVRTFATLQGRLPDLNWVRCR